MNAKPATIPDMASLETVCETLTTQDEPDPLRMTVPSATLAPWTGSLTQALLPRFDTRGKGVLPRVFSRGARLFWAVEVSEPVLGCNVRIASQRQVLP